MKSDQSRSHRIKSTVFEVEYPDEATAFRLRVRLEELFERDVLPDLEDIFESCAPAGASRRFERVVIDLGRIDPDRLDAAVVRGLVRSQFARYVREGDVVDETDSLVEDAFCAFLESGVLPWDSPYSSVDALAGAVTAMEVAAAEVLAARVAVLLERRQVRARLARQFGGELIAWLIRRIRPVAAEPLLRAVRSVIRSQAREVVWEAALVILPDMPQDRAPATAELGERIRDVVADAGALSAGTPQVLDSPTRRELRPRKPAYFSRDTKVQEAYVSHAGVVLLHPFLRRLYENLKYIDRGGRFVSEEDRTRAVHVLHYLASGAEEPAEHETVLLKCLCGVPMEAALVRHLPLREREREEADRVLPEVIRHWEKLGGTSPQGLRDGFLAREGKLTRRPAGWALAVERKSIDVLLDYLPWSIAVIRLPWCDSPLYVDWV